LSEQAPTGPVSTAAPGGAAVIFIFITLLLDTLALGVVIPVLPKLIEASTNPQLRRGLKDHLKETEEQVARNEVDDTTTRACLRVGGLCSR